MLNLLLADVAWLYILVDFALAFSGIFWDSVCCDEVKKNHCNAGFV